jgi:D-alanyl-lipoteichoic acid acyltransferase DltB (MBOAT superfamily)
MFTSAIVDYYTSIFIYLTPRSNKNKRKFFLTITLLINLGLLFYFKYLYFLTDNSNFLLNYFNINYKIPLFNILLPFGISFYTFETISYTVDVYRGVTKPEKSFTTYALFVTFFPKLVAGPIQRASELISQINRNRYFKLDYFFLGFKSILYGLFLKVVVADNISGIVDDSFKIAYQTASAIDVITLSFLFGFQIYFDFSAYSFIAIGSARLLGIEIPENFNYPYIASSLKDFWKRWHISLSSWIRDYLYLPLSGIRVINSSGKLGIGNSLDNKSKKNYLPLFITWSIMGFWHGANWTFLFWGFYHAFFIFIERKFLPLRNTYAIFRNSILNWGITLIIIMLSWIPFRVKTLNETFILYSRLFSYKNYTYISLRENIYIISFLLLFLFLITYFFEKYIKYELEKNIYCFYIYSFLKYFFIIFLTFVFLRPINQFIYFQF